MTDQPLTRRELREAARAAEFGAPEPVEWGAPDAPQSGEPEAPAVNEEVAPPAPASRREARERDRSSESNAASIVGASLFGQLPEFATQSQIDNIQLPATGPIKILEPTAIVLDSVPDITNMSVVLPDSGVVIQTGAIELPWLKDDTAENAGIVEAAAVADQSLMADNAPTGINPIPARVHERTRRKASVFPSKLRRGWGIVYLTALSAFVLGALFCAFLAALMLGAIKL